MEKGERLMRLAAMACLALLLSTTACAQENAAQEAVAVQAVESHQDEVIKTAQISDVNRDPSLNESENSTLQVEAQVTSVDRLLENVLKNALKDRDIVRLPAAGLTISEYKALLAKKDNLGLLIGSHATAEERAFVIAETKALDDEIYRDEKGNSINCYGIAKQGGLVVCQTTPNAHVEVGRSEHDT